jgi:NAD(P) transhydrogenase subunit alpha
MAVESGGNVEGSKINQIVNHKGVKIMGLSNLPSFTANHSSFALSNNLINFVLEFYNQEQGDLEIDFEDEIIKSALLVNKGKITNEVFK